MNRDDIAVVMINQYVRYAPHARSPAYACSRIRSSRKMSAL